jgi:xylulokinase
MGRDDLVLPRIVEPRGSSGSRGAALLGAGAGDNAAAMLGLDAAGDTVVSVGTSGVVMARHDVRPADPTGTVAGFADATGAYLPLACTLNAARVLDATAALLGVDLARLSELALSAPPGSEGVVLVPYLEGERTPNLPHATGALHGLTLTNATPANVARAAVEGMLCGLAAGQDALGSQGVPLTGVWLIGGAAASPAVRNLAPSVFGVPAIAPVPSEYVADGAARQAAWLLSQAAEPPDWSAGVPAAQRYESAPTPGLRERYADATAHYLPR